MPLYRAVKRVLMQAIEDGRLAPGAALANEATLSKHFGVSIGTLRQAVGELVSEHVLVRRQGRGTFVARHSAERFLFQFFHVERGRLDDEAAEALGRRGGEAAWLFDNRLLLQGRAVVHDCIALPAVLFRGLNEKRLRERPGTIYRLYQDEFAITVVRAVERARAVAADRATASVLGVASGTPMLQVRRTALSFGDKPVEYRVSTVHTALHDYVQTLSRPT